MPSATRTARKLAAATVAAAGIGVLALPGAASAGSVQAAGDHHRHHDGARTVSFWTTVRADDADGRTTVRVRPGQWVKLQAFGRADCNRNDGSDACRFGPGGNDTDAPAGWLAPGVDEFSLVARVGDGAWKQAGPGRVKLTGDGRLTLAYNDRLGTYDDNRGGFFVRVTQCLRRC